MKLETISTVSSNYFHPLQDLDDKKMSKGKKVGLIFFKMLSYITVIVPLVMFFLHAGSTKLAGRAYKLPFLEQDPRINSLANDALIPSKSNSIVPILSDVSHSQTNVIVPIVLPILQQASQLLDEPLILPSKDSKLKEERSELNHVNDKIDQAKDRLTAPSISSPARKMLEEHLHLYKDLNKLLSKNPKTKEDLNEIDRFFDSIDKIKIKDCKGLKKQYIDQINAIRQPLWKKIRNNVLEDKNTPEDKHILNRLDLISYKFSLRPYKGEIKDHMYLIKNKYEIEKFDGKIISNNGNNLQSGEKTIPFIEGESHWDKLPGYNSSTKEINFFFEQLPALSQVKGTNFLCSYYALFFLKQLTENKSLTDREDFNADLKKWISSKSKKNILAEIREKEVIFLKSFIDTNITSLDPNGICKIAESYHLFENNNQWLVIDQFGISEDEKAIGMTSDLKIYPAERRGNKTNFPLFMIKQIKQHYYCIKAEKNDSGILKFTIAHSLSDNIGSEWENAEWEDLLNSMALFV
jgi:hypothetical protein